MKQSVLFERFAPVVPLVRPAPAPPFAAEDGDADAWYELGCRLEAASAVSAAAAYRRALALDGAHADALVNFGRLLHLDGDVEAAELHYRRAAAVRPGDAVAAFNLGVALQDLGRPRLAIEAYLRALDLDPATLDAHFNLAGLYLEIGRRATAIRHLQRYKSLRAF